MSGAVMEGIPIEDVKTPKIVTQTFRTVLPVQIMGVIVAAINGFVNSIVTSNFIGDKAMAAIGFFAPVSTAVGIAYVVITGVQILCSKYIGSGDRDRVAALFSTCIVAVSAFCLAITAGCLLFSEPLAALLGAKGETATHLVGYIRGYSPGIVGQVLSGMLMSFLPLNNDVKRVNVGIATMLVTTISLDLLLGVVLKVGTFGMGVASSVSYLLALVVMFPSFLKEGHAVRFRMGNYCFGELASAAVLGLPSLMFTVGCTAKGYILNQTLARYVGDAAVAAMNVQGNVCAIAGAIPIGIGNTFRSLGGMYYGERDRSSYTGLMSHALKVGLVMSLAATALIMVCSNPISSLFYEAGTEAWLETRRMLLLFPSFLPLNLMFTLFMASYQIQDQMGLVNVLSAGENIIMAIIAAIAAPFIAADAVWLSFPLAELVCLAIIAFFVFMRSRGITFKLIDWMKLGPTFGVSDEDCLEFSVQNMDDVSEISDKVMDFCKEHGLNQKETMVSGLAVEEMAGNVVEHGFPKSKKTDHSVDIRVVYDDGITIRIRDDCPAFDPNDRINQFHPEDPLSDVGIRMIKKLCKEMRYYYNVGINTLIISL